MPAMRFYFQVFFNLFRQLSTLFTIIPPTTTYCQAKPDNMQYIDFII